MQVSVEEISSVERRLTIVVPVEKVEAVYKQTLQELSAKADIKGFRRGKIPVDYIKQRFGQTARSETLSKVIEESLRQALQENKLQPVNTPSVEPKEIAEDKPLEFIATFEILPTIDKIQFNMDQVEKLKVELTDADIERVINQLQKQSAAVKKVEREAQAHDRVIIDYYSIFAGENDAENKTQNVPIELGSKTMIPGFEEGLLGAKVGEERRFNLTYPADYHVAERAGKEVEFVVDVKDVLEVELPTVDEAFIQKLGVKSGTLDDLKKQIHQTLDKEREREVNERLKEKIFTQLLEQNPINIPSSLIEQEAERIHHEMHPQHKNQPEHKHSDEELAQFRDMAKKRVALGILFSAYVKEANLRPDEARVKKRIEDIASIYEQPDQIINWLTNDKQQHNAIMGQVLEEQVIEKLTENTPAVEKSISYAELKGIRE